MILKKTTLSVVASIAVISMIGLSGCGDNKGSSQTSSSSSSSSSTSGGQPQEKVSTITAVDGFLIGKFKKALSVTVNGKTYKSEITIGSHGLITFKGVDIKQGKGDIVVPKGIAKVDSDNDGKVSDADKDLAIEMSAPSNASVISPLTTLLIQMKAEGVAIPAGFEVAVLNFNPVTQVKGDATAQKLIVLNEVLKTSMAVVTPAEFVKVDVAGLMKAKTLKDVNIDTLVAKLPESVKAKAGAKAKIIKSILPIAKGLKAGVNFQTLIVAISDGGQTLQQAFHTAAPTLVTSDSVSPSAIVSSVMVSGLKSTSITYITNVINTVSTSIASVKAENYEAVVEVTPEPVEEEESTTSSSGGATTSSGGATTTSSGGTPPTITNPKLTLTGGKVKLGSVEANITGSTFSDINISHTNDASSFYNISLTGLSGDKNFTDKALTFTITVTNKADNTDFVKMEVQNAKLTKSGNTFTTNFPTTTKIVLTEDQNGTEKRYSRDIKTAMSNNDLSFNLQTIIDNFNDPDITNGFNRMKGYLNTPNKSYTLKAEVSVSGVDLDLSTITGTINVN